MEKVVAVYSFNRTKIMDIDVFPSSHAEKYDAKTLTVTRNDLSICMPSTINELRVVFRGIYV